MRVLHMIPDIGISNGVMSVILNYAKAMPDDIRFDVIYFSEKEKTKKSDIEALGGRVYKTDKPSPKDLLGGKLNAFFNEHKGEWEALHIHCPHFALFIAPAAKKAGIKKICVHCHTVDYSLKGNSKRNKLLSLYAKYAIKTKFACSNAAGKVWYGSKPFTVLNNAIDCATFTFDKDKRNQIRKQMDLEDAFVVSHIGRTDVTQKNHPFILKTFAQIKSKMPNSKLMLIGADENEQTKTLCSELSITDDVMFLGVRGDIPDLLQGADIFLFPSISEGLPVSVVEAQAAGLPVLLSDTVTNEVVASDNVHCLSLNESPEYWADKAVELSKIERKNTFDKMQSSGWDIFDTANRLVDYYRG